MKYFSADDNFVSRIYGELIIPFLLYMIINLTRLLSRNKTIFLLTIEIGLNLIFSFVYGLNHLLFFALTAISILIFKRTKNSIIE